MQKKLNFASQDLEVAYQQMAQDEKREAEALEWAEATAGDVRDEPLSKEEAGLPKSDDQSTVLLRGDELPRPEPKPPLEQEEQEEHSEPRKEVPPQPMAAAEPREQKKRFPLVGMGLVGLVLLLGGGGYLLLKSLQEETFRPPVETTEQGGLAQKQNAREAEEKRRREQEQQDAEQEKRAAEEARQREIAKQQAEKEKQQQEEKQLAAFFLRADEQARAQRLITPAGNNALETYRQIWQLRPEHKEALEGIQQVKTQYVQLAEKVKREEQWEKADEYYEKALSIDPQDAALQKLRQETVEQKRTVEEARQQKIAKQQAEKEKQQQKYKNMVQIPAGTFWMGCKIDVDKNCFDHEKPGREVYLDAFWIDTYEVTVADYRRCEEAGNCSKKNLTEYDSCNWNKPDRADHPINCVGWNQAQNYCQGLGKRLPTEAEWEKAARGVEGWVYPWGNIWDASKANTSEGKLGRTAPGGSYRSGISAYKVQDMSGNVWEWVQDWYAEDYYKNGPTRNPRGPDMGERRSVRGGSWFFNRWLARVAPRRGLPPGGVNVHVGFRCASS